MWCCFLALINDKKLLRFDVVDAGGDGDKDCDEFLRISVILTSMMLVAIESTSRWSSKYELCTSRLDNSGGVSCCELYHAAPLLLLRRHCCSVPGLDRVDTPLDITFGVCTGRLCHTFVAWFQFASLRLIYDVRSIFFIGELVILFVSFLDVRCRFVMSF